MNRFKVRISISLCVAILALFCSTGANASAMDDNDTTPRGTLAVKQQNNAKNSIVQTGIATSDQEQNIYELPSSYSSADNGYVFSAKSQKYNDCWAYGSCAVFETKLLKSNESITPLSETFINYWATGNFSTKGWQRGYRENGYSYIPTGCFTSWNGPRFESDFPITTPYINYDAVEAQSYAPYGVTDIEYLYRGEDEKIKSAIYRNGAVLASFTCNNEYFNDNNTAFFCPYKMSDSNLEGHTIAIVGWDDNFSNANFSNNYKLPENNGAWLIKNSWGSYNNDNGYFWISYEDSYIFSDVFGINFSINDYMKIDETDTLYQNEIYGATYSFKPIDYQDNTTFINVFDFSDEYTQLDKIIFETSSEGVPYTVYYIPVDDGTPTGKTDDWSKLYEGVTDHAGYICADIDDIDLPDSTGAIGIKMSNPEESTPLSNAYNIGVSEWLQISSGKYIFYNDSKYGDCFITVDDDIVDLMDYYKEYHNDDLGGTFVIKAVGTVDDDYEKVLGDLDLDYTLTIKDVTYLQKCLTDIETMTRLKKANADFDQNGDINISDATAIQKVLAV